MNTSVANAEVVNDIVHELITLPPHIKAIIDTDQFQRLRHVSQMGMVKFVYPSVTHSRFEHSIGTFHLTSELLKTLSRDLDLVLKTKLKIGVRIDHLVQCIEIAALCHDLGHGPFSHAWDHAIFPYMETDEAVKPHEAMAVEILEDLLTNTEDKRLERFKDRDSLNLIGAIILGDFEKKRGKLNKEKKQLKQNENLTEQEKIEKQEKLTREIKQFEKYENMPFIFQIVANKKSGLDLDKCDYLCRDPIYLGWSNRDRIRDIGRMIHFYRLAKYKGDGKWHLALRNKEIFNVSEIFYSRHKLHRYGSQHRTVRAVEGMFKKAVSRVFKGNEVNKRKLFKRVMGNAWTGPVSLSSKAFISKACDHHVWEMIRNYDPEKVVEKINKRDLYKLLCTFQIKTDPRDAHDMEHHAKEFDMILNGGEDATTFYVDICKFRLRSELEGDPMEMIPFYEPQSPNECFKFGDEDRMDSLPKLVQLVNDEDVLMIFKLGKIANRDRQQYFTPIKQILSREDGVYEETWQNDLKTYVDENMSGCEFHELHY